MIKDINDQSCVLTIDICVMIDCHIYLWMDIVHYSFVRPSTMQHLVWVL